MYEEFFGLSEKPFNNSPDPRFLFLTASLEEALKTIICGINDGLGLISIVGEAGTGKTMMLHAAANWLGPKTRVAFVNNFNLSFLGLLKLILVELKNLKSGERLTTVKAIQKLKEIAEEQFSLGGTVAVFVDEAHNLKKNDLANFRQISNIATSTNNLVQIIFCGQHELDRKLKKPELSQLRERLNCRCQIEALTKTEVGGYIKHRLSVTGYAGPDIFSVRALGLIWKYTSGIPRRINRLVDSAMNVAFENNLQVIQSRVLERAFRMID